MAVVSSAVFGTLGDIALYNIDAPIPNCLENTNRQIYKLFVL